MIKLLPLVTNSISSLSSFPGIHSLAVLATKGHPEPPYGPLASSHLTDIQKDTHHSEDSKHLRNSYGNQRLRAHTVAQDPPITQEITGVLRALCQTGDKEHLHIS
jgi:hypothetical protein